MLHDTQKILLKRLYLQNNRRYGELTRGYDYEDNIAFHLKQLIEKGLVTKKSGLYSLTAPGVKAITGYHLPDLNAVGAKTLIVGFLCHYQNLFLIKEHPHAKENFYNLPSGKPVFGENIETALVDTFSGYTSLRIDPKSFFLLSLHLKTVKTSEAEILFDDAFAIYQITLDTTQYEQVKPANNALWITKDDLAKLPNRWPELDICILKNDKSPYLAYDFISDYILN